MLDGEKMNQKDRQALDKFMDDDVLTAQDKQRFTTMSDGERAMFIAERFFEAGANHGRSQLDNLKNDNTQELYDLIKKLQTENEELFSLLGTLENISDSHSVMTKQEINAKIYQFLIDKGR